MGADSHINTDNHVVNVVAELILGARTCRASLLLDGQPYPIVWVTDGDRVMASFGIYQDTAWNHWTFPGEGLEPSGVPDWKFAIIDEMTNEINALIWSNQRATIDLTPQLKQVGHHLLRLYPYDENWIETFSRSFRR